jgi:hypothetical protein
MPEINNGLQTLNDDILAAKTDIAKLREDFCKIVYQVLKQASFYSGLMEGYRLA